MDLFITGTDTDVGKTCVTAGLAVLFQKSGIDVGIMKPFATGVTHKGRYASKDVEILSKISHIHDDEKLVNPQFFPIPASPYTACKNLKIRPKINYTINNFKKLQRYHDMILVEGIGGLLTPIKKNYYVADLIKKMDIPAILVTKSRIGTINHTIMTCEMCKKYKIPLKGIIINEYGGGYPINQLTRDLSDLTGIKILGSIPTINDMSRDSLYDIFQKLDTSFLQS